MHTANLNLHRTPWRSMGTLPDSDSELKELQKDPKTEQLVNYGSHYLDKVISDFKPDVYIAAQDIWGIDFAMGKNWFKKINSVFWTTLDSLPILPAAVTAAKKVDNFWIWSSFATDEMHKMGLDHVKTMHGPVEDKFFRPLPKEIKSKIRGRFNIPEDLFIVGFVFRNQLRKSVPNLLEGFAQWKKWNPDKKGALLLHTHFGEGWNIMKLAEEHGVKPEEILCTYVCRECNNYQIDRFTGVERECTICGEKEKKPQITCNVNNGVSEYQLSDVYNVMDVYCHPFTSGGQEYPIQEAKLCGLITLVTNYSCGVEMCQDDAHSLPLEWSEYREHGTEFIKASTSPRSIAKQLNKVSSMSLQKRTEKGLKARKWALDNYSISNVGKKIENVIDSFPSVNWDDIKVGEVSKDPYYQIPKIEDDEEWVLHVYHNIMKMEFLDGNDSIVSNLVKQIKSGETTREKVESKMRDAALKSAEEEKYKDFEIFLSDDDKGKRILYVMPQGPSDIFMSTSLFESIKEQYPDYNLYVATQEEYMEMLDGNPHVHKTIPYFAVMDNCFWAEGKGDYEGYFEISFTPHLSTQKNIEYLHNGKDKIAFDINV